MFITIQSVLARSLIPSNKKEPPRNVKLWYIFVHVVRTDNCLSIQVNLQAKIECSDFTKENALLHKRNSDKLF